MSILKIESIDSKGYGVAHLDGKTIFVEGALPKETVSANIYKKKATFDWAKTTRILKESAFRVAPECAYFGTCGGCAMQHLALHAQLASKARALEDAFKHIGNVQAEILFAPIAGNAWNYRHRARLSVRYVAKKNEVLIGFHEKKSSFIMDMKSCAILPPKISHLLIPLRKLIHSLSVFERVPQIEVSVGKECVALVLRILSPLNANDEERLKNFAHTYDVVFYLQEKGTESLKRFYPLNNPELFYDLPEFDLKMPFLPTDFTQVNHAVNQILVRRALALLDVKKCDALADFFCGLGNFTLPIARLASSVLGIEAKESLIARAKQNANLNGIENAQFEAHNLFESVFFDSFDFSQFNKILIDPPREGAIDLVKALPQNNSSIEKIVYVSCNPATLARDAAVLVHCKNYVLKGAGVVNMFSHTAHVESIAVFEKR